MACFGDCPVNELPLLIQYGFGWPLALAGGCSAGESVTPSCRRCLGVSTLLVVRLLSVAAAAVFQHASLFVRNVLGYRKVSQSVTQKETQWLVVGGRNTDLSYTWHWFIFVRSFLFLLYCTLGPFVLNLLAFVSMM